MLQITSWALCEQHPGDVTFQIGGTINDKAFECRVSFEIDGRDAEIEVISGPHPLDEDMDFWDTLYTHPIWPACEAAMTAAM